MYFYIYETPIKTASSFLFFLVMIKNLPGNAEDLDSILGSGRSTGEGNGNPLQYSCLQNSRDRRAWQALVHEVAKSQT